MKALLIKLIVIGVISALGEAMLPPGRLKNGAERLISLAAAAAIISSVIGMLTGYLASL